MLQKLALWLAAIVMAAVFPFVWERIPAAQAQKPLPPAIREMHFDLFEPQKVVYHVTYPAGFLDQNYLHLLTVASNHMNAVGEGFLDLHIIMQGDGLDLLMLARKSPKIAGAVDRLRKQGVRFVVCWNTLIARNIDPDTMLYNLDRRDIVWAGIAEAARLQAQGYVYMKP